jgi:hypothetical protein
MNKIFSFRLKAVLISRADTRRLCLSSYVILKLIKKFLNTIILRFIIMFLYKLFAKWYSECQGNEEKHFSTFPPRQKSCRIFQDA